MTPFDFWLALWIEGVLLPFVGASGRNIETMFKQVMK